MALCNLLGLKKSFAIISTVLNWEPERWEGFVYIFMVIRPWGQSSLLPLHRGRNWDPEIAAFPKANRRQDFHPVLAHSDNTPHTNCDNSNNKKKWAQVTLCVKVCLDRIFSNGIIGPELYHSCVITNWPCALAVPTIKTVLFLRKQRHYVVANAILNNSIA